MTTFAALLLTRNETALTADLSFCSGWLSLTASRAPRLAAQGVSLVSRACDVSGSEKGRKKPYTYEQNL